MFLSSTFRTESPSACICSMRSKNACVNDMYSPPRERVINQSRPPIGAIELMCVGVEYWKVPTFAPQYHEFLNGRPICAAPNAGTNVISARTVDSARILRIRKNLEVRVLESQRLGSNIRTTGCFGGSRSGALALHVSVPEHEPMLSVRPCC